VARPGSGTGVAWGLKVALGEGQRRADFVLQRKDRKGRYQLSNDVSIVCSSSIIAPLRVAMSVRGNAVMFSAASMLLARRVGYALSLLYLARFEEGEVWDPFPCSF
jgi:flagellar biosynthesis regulator FlbT